jgi:hypothetical protein
MLYRRRRKPQALAIQAIELMFAIPQVVSHRLARLSRDGQSLSPRDRRELYLMGAEKIEAFYESWNAMLLEVLRANLKLTLAFWCAPWTGRMRVPGLSSRRSRRSALSVLESGLDPFHRRTMANARRLRRARVV